MFSLRLQFSDNAVRDVTWLARPGYHLLLYYRAGRRWRITIALAYTHIWTNTYTDTVSLSHRGGIFISNVCVQTPQSPYVFQPHVISVRWKLIFTSCALRCSGGSVSQRQLFGGQFAFWLIMEMLSQVELICLLNKATRKASNEDFLVFNSLTLRVISESHILIWT
jgi:hypothetical protein